MKTTVVVFPFDLFGGSGCSEGATLLADALREMLDDNRREKVRTRADCYTPHVRLRELAFETLDALADWRRQGRQSAHQALLRGDFLLWLSGNHLGALPVYDALAGSNTLIVQLDAHLDVHHFHDTSTELSHGNFLLYCDGPLPPLINVGHRDLLLPAEQVARAYRQAFSAPELATEPQRVLEQVRQASAAAERIVLDIDCDVFDPAFFPAVSQPTPFGLTPHLVLRLIDALGVDRLAGLLVSEFSPARDHRDESLAILAWLIEYLLLRRYE